MFRSTDGRVDEQLRCSFCEKSQADVRKLIAGPAVFICDECVSVCQDIIADDVTRATTVYEVKTPELLPKTSLTVRCALCGMMTPLNDVVPIRNRGVLCLGCAGEVEAAAAERREPPK